MSSLNIFEKALLEGLTSKESDLLISMTYIYNIPSNPPTTPVTQKNPGKFLPVLQGYNPNGGKSTDRLVPYTYDNKGSNSFNETKTLYMFSIKEFDTTESNFFNNTFLLGDGISDDLIFDSNANIYSYQAYEAAWVTQFPTIPPSIIQQDMDTIVNSIKNNTTYFNYFNTLLNNQPTPVYNIDHSKDSISINQTLSTQITPAKPGDRTKETVNNTEILYNTAFNNFNYLPSDLSVYPIYIPSMFFQYFLYKASASSTDNWHIIYNPVHRQHYCDYWMSQNVNTATPTGAETTNMHMINYGNIFKTSNNNGSYFIDPVCTCVTPLSIVYPNTTINTKPSYVGPYINNPNKNPANINVSDYYATYTTLSQGNIYNYNPVTNLVLPRSFYNTNNTNKLIEVCKSSCSNNNAAQVDSSEPYTYTRPLIHLTYYRNSSTMSTTTSNIYEDILPLWGKMSFINYVNGRSYSTNTGNIANIENSMCNPTTINNLICNTVLSGAGDINITNNASLGTTCGQGGGQTNPSGQPDDGQQGGKTNQSGKTNPSSQQGGGPSTVPSKNNTTIIIIIILLSFLGLGFIFFLFYYIYNKSKNKSNQKINQIKK